jgi:hypothetical protein
MRFVLLKVEIREAIKKNSSYRGVFFMYPFPANSIVCSDPTNAKLIRTVRNFACGQLPFEVS